MLKIFLNQNKDASVYTGAFSFQNDIISNKNKFHIFFDQINNFIK